MRIVTSMSRSLEVRQMLKETPRTLSPEPSGAIAADLGGTWMRAALVYPDGRCDPIVRRATRRNRPSEQIISDLAAVIEQVCEQAGLASSECAAVALGVPTVLDDEGRLAACDNLPTMPGISLGEEIRRVVDIPVVLFNDAACFTMGEWWMGVGKGTRYFCGVTIGTGIGAGIVIDGRIYHGSHGCAGEIWKSPLGDTRGKAVEDTACARAIEQEYRNRSGHNVEAEEIAALARSGDTRALETFVRFGRSLGTVMCSLINTVDPEAVAFGGSVSESFEFFRGALAKTVAWGAVAGTKVILERSLLGEKAALLGAARLFWDEQERNARENQVSSTERESVFLAEVAEQPDALRNLVAFYSGDGRSLLAQWKEWAAQRRGVRFCGMGTSELAPEMVSTALAASGVAASTIDAGELVHYPRPSNELVVLLSQSGESAETRKLAEQLESRGNLIAITNNLQSALARSAELVLPLCAGHERAITSKTYVNTLSVLFLMAECLRGPEALERALDRLRQAAEALPECDRDGVACAASLLSDSPTIHFISRGPGVVAAKQAALGFIEGARVHATAFTGGAFRHGPFELVDRNHRCVFFIPGGATFELLKAMATEVAEKGSHVVVITDQDVVLPGSECCVLRTPDFGEDLFCLSAATTQELLLDAVACRRGMRAGEFRHGEKITSRE